MKGVIYRDFKLENFFLDDFGKLLIYIGYLVFYYFILMLWIVKNIDFGFLNLLIKIIKR